LISSPVPLYRRVAVSLDGRWVSPVSFGWNRVVFKHLSLSKPPAQELGYHIPSSGFFCGPAEVRFYKMKVLVFGVKSGEGYEREGKYQQTPGSLHFEENR